MEFKFVILWTDALVYMLLAAVMLFVFFLRKNILIRHSIQMLLQNRLAMVSLIALLSYATIGVLDSIHFRKALPLSVLHPDTHYSTKVSSVFDELIAPLGQQLEKTYSAPFSTVLFVKEIVEKPDGTIERTYPRLKHAGIGISDRTQKIHDIQWRLAKAFFMAIIISFCLLLLIAAVLSRTRKESFSGTLDAIIKNRMKMHWRLILITASVLLFVIFASIYLADNYHIFGTDKIGQDVFYQTLKSIRTGLVIGLLTTLIMLPFAILLGISAGYLGGRIDDAIQYVYTTLSSIPGVLLIAAAILSLQVYISQHSDKFPTIPDRADARLLALCIILGITSWTGLCRLLRAETLKLREVDYVQASKALGAHHFKILLRHILPNVMHIVLIAVVIDFSSLVLAEAVLSYVGVGVDPSAISWGNMINSARLELAREPVVWWPLLAAFVFMFSLVLVANLFADAVRDAFDPRIR